MFASPSLLLGSFFLTMVIQGLCLRLLTRNRVENSFLSMIVRSQVYSLIGPFWFRVLSTFETGISLDNLTSSSPHFFANHSSIKTPCAPLLMRALVVVEMWYTSDCKNINKKSFRRSRHHD